jgi:integrase
MNESEHYVCRHALGRVSLGTAGVNGAKTVAEARAEATRHTEAAKLSGGRVHVRRQERAKAREERSAVRLSKIIDAYLLDGEKRLRPRSYVEFERHLRKDWQALHSRPANSISRDDIVACLDRIEERGAFAADRARAALSAMFSWAINRDYGRGINPCLGIAARAPSNGGRVRVLSLDELAEIWRACPDDSYGRIVRLLLLLGARRDEVGALQWSEVRSNCSGLQIELPAARVKNARDHVIPLADQAVALLPPKQDGQPYLFGRYGSAPFGGWSKCKAALDDTITANRRKAGI